MQLVVTVFCSLKTVLFLKLKNIGYLIVKLKLFGTDHIMRGNKL